MASSTTGMWMRRTASVALAVVHASVVLVRHACVTAPCGDAQALATSDSSLTRSARIGGRCEFVRSGAMNDNGARCTQNGASAACPRGRCSPYAALRVYMPEMCWVVGAESEVHWCNARQALTNPRISNRQQRRQRIDATVSM